MRRSWMALADSRSTELVNVWFAILLHHLDGDAVDPLWGTNGPPGGPGPASGAGRPDDRLDIGTDHLNDDLTVLNRAVCTWAMEADASGVSSNPRTASRRATALLLSGGGRPDHRKEAPCPATGPALRPVSGSRSRRVESIWPNLMKMGPSA